MNNGKRRRLAKEAGKQHKPNMPGKMMEAKAYAAGVRAARYGMMVDSNPFMEGTLFYLKWKEGYMDEIEKIKKEGEVK